MLLSSISGGREQRSCDDGLKGMSANWWSGIVAVRTWKIFADIRKQEKTDDKTGGVFRIRNASSQRIVLSTPKTPDQRSNGLETLSGHFAESP